MHPSTIRVLLADDHPAIAEGVQAHLERAGGIVVVGSVASYEAVLTTLASTQVDVLILDIVGMRGAPQRIVERLRREHPAVAIVIFSALIDMAPELLAAGVTGYASKSDPLQDLVYTVEAARAGRRFLSRTARNYLDATSTVTQHVRLSPRELMVVKLLAQGFSTKEVAERLTLKIHSVQNHITGALTKLGYSRRNQLVEWYQRIFGAD